MNEFYKFSSESPFLTFFIVLLVTEMVVRCCTIIFNRNEVGEEDED